MAEEPTRQAPSTYDLPQEECSPLRRLLPAGGRDPRTVQGVDRGYHRWPPSAVPKTRLRNEAAGRLS